MKINCLPLATLCISLFAGSHLAQAQTGVKAAAKVYLQGALIGVPAGETLMRDDLRAKNLVPLQDPYSGRPYYHHLAPGGSEAITDPGVLAVTGQDAIVDWVFIELRAANDPGKLLHTRSALLQRDGDVVDMDGTSHVLFTGVAADEYYLAMRHRNHLAVFSNGPIELVDGTTTIEFSNPNTPAYGTNPQAPIGDNMALWAGDINANGWVGLQGPSNDLFQIFARVIANADNIFDNANFILAGYYDTDIDLDGETTYGGPSSDRSKIFSDVFGAYFQLTGPPFGQGIQAQHP